MDHPQKKSQELQSVHYFDRKHIRTNSTLTVNKERGSSKGRCKRDHRGRVEKEKKHREDGEKKSHTYFFVLHSQYSPWLEKDSYLSFIKRYKTRDQGTKQQGYCMNGTNNNFSPPPDLISPKKKVAKKLCFL